MKGIKYLGLFLVALTLTPLEAANQAGLNIGFPTSVKGEQHSGFILGGVVSTLIMPKVVVDAGLDFMNLQFADGTQRYVGYSIAGRYTVYEWPDMASVDAFLGLEGNGFSGAGLTVGGMAKYKVSASTEARLRLSLNTNQDVLVSAQLVKEFKLPDFGGPKAADPVVPEVAPTVVAAVVPIVVPEVAPIVVPAVANPILSEPAYKDIAGHWAKPDIEWAAAHGIFSPADRFAPNATINRFSADSIVKKIATYLNVPNAANGISFSAAVTKKAFVTGVLRTIAVSRGNASPSDADIAQVAKTLKVSDVWLAPSDKPVSRAEAAVVVSRLLQALPK